MFSGIHSLLFGKKHHKVKQNDPIDGSQPSADNEFVILERRHSDEYDRNPGLYPDLDPSQPPSSNLPYAISPSLPNLKEASSGNVNAKDETKIDMLQGVPFVLSSQILLLQDVENKNFLTIVKSINEIKNSGEENLLEDFTYDFELEHTIFSEFSSCEA